MSAKDDKIDQFISAMFNLTNAIESDFEQCCKICGCTLSDQSGLEN